MRKHQALHEADIERYTEAIRLKPDDAVAYVNRGAAKGELGRYKEAISDFDEAIRLKSDYVTAYCNRGISWHYWLKDAERALADLEHAAYLAKKQNDSAGLKIANDFIKKVKKSLKSSEET